VAALLGDDLLGLTLFGSRARGEGHEESDLDVLVLVRRADREVRRRVLDAAADVDFVTGLRISPLVLDEAAFARSFPLRDAVVRDGVPL
jgi:predicted nucleotidyltransferase